MKKILLLIAVIIILSGCGTTETLTCRADNTVGNLTSLSTYKIDYKGNDVEKITVTYEYKDKHVDGMGTGTDGTTNDTDTDSDGIVDGVVGEALDDIVTGVSDGILDLAGIKTRHSNRFGTYTNTKGFTTMVDTDTENDYKVTYTYNLKELSDTDLTTFGLSRDYNTQKKTYTDRGLTCK